MEQFDFTKPTPFYDIILNVEEKKLYCNRAFLAIWSPVFETMFKSNFRERDSMEINLPGKSFDDMKELLAVIYPPNRPIVATNVQRLLELADVNNDHVFFFFNRFLLGISNDGINQTLSSLSHATTMNDRFVNLST